MSGNGNRPLGIGSIISDIEEEVEGGDGEVVSCKLVSW